MHAGDVVDPVAFIEDWAATFNVNSPVLQSAFYDRSEETEVFVSSGHRYQGHEAIKKAYEDDQSQLRYYDSTVSKMTSRILGDTALVSFEHRFKIHFLADDSRWQMHVRTTSVLLRDKNSWRIVLEHSSPIHRTKRMTRIQPLQDDIGQ